VERSLKHFLAGQQIGTLDSVGEFTLCSAQAMEKMARHQLASPGLWLVKVAQAAVSLRASEVSYDFERSRAVIRFFGTPPIDGQELGRSLLSGELPGEAWKHHLVVGLRAFMAQEPKRLAWLDSSNRLTVVGAAKSPRAEGSKEDRGATLVIMAELQPPSGLFKWVSQSSFDPTAISRHCQLCHVPIRVNGSCVSRQFPPRREVLKGLDQESIALVLECFGNKLPLVVASFGNADPALSTVPKLRLEPHKVGALAVLSSLPYFVSPVSQCYWVKDGALLEPRPIEFRFQSRTRARYSLSLYLDGSDVRVDASHFSAPQVDVDWLFLQATLRKLVSKMDLARRPNKQMGWTAQERAVEDRRALIEAIEWMRF
jgi:hypothetical protein